VTATMKKIALVLIPVGFLIPFLMSQAKASSPQESQWKADVGSQRPRPKITVSKATTFFTEPLDENGCVDYLTALNRHCSEGVTPENNAAVPFWRAVGPRRIDPKVRRRYFELLGMSELPEEGEYLVPFCDFLSLYRNEHELDGNADKDASWTEEAYKQFDQAQQEPWSKEQFPIVAALLEKNVKPLETLVEGLERPRFYSPAVAAEGRSLARMELLIGLQEARDASRQFAARAMLRMQQGDRAGAWNDTLAVYRLARLNSQRPFLVDRLVAGAMQGLADGAAIALSRREDVTAVEARKCQLQLKALPAMRSMCESLNVGERIYCLDCIRDMALNREQSYVLSSEFLLSFADEDMNKCHEAVVAILKEWNENWLDWNEVLRLANLRIDGWIEAADQPTVAKCLEKYDRLDKEMNVQAREAANRILAGERSGAEVLTESVLNGLGFLGSVHKGSFIADVKNQVQAELTLLAFALAGYRADHQQYPGTLGELAPKYIDAIPKDGFTGGDLHYQPKADGFLLYSLGPNGKDDGGRNHITESESRPEDHKASEEELLRDDIAIRILPQ